MGPSFPKLATFMDEAEEDVLAYTTLPPAHWVTGHSTNSLELPNSKIKRPTNIVGIFPNREAVIRLVGAIVMQQNDKWTVQRARCTIPETIARSAIPISSVCITSHSCEPGSTTSDRCHVFASNDCIGSRK
jgi:transposase-like protein